MKNKISQLIYLALLVLFFSACSKSNAKTEETVGKIAQQDLQNEVKVHKLEYSIFSKELVSNGKLYAVNKCELDFEGSGVLVHMPISNGKLVKEGDLLGKLNDFDARNSLDKNRQAMVKSKLDFEDLLIGQGHSLVDTAKMEKELLEVIKIKSGYSTAQTNYKQALQTLKGAKIYAPFSGVIANSNGYLHAKVRKDKPFCILIDNSAFNVEFFVMESELVKEM